MTIKSRLLRLSSVHELTGSASARNGSITSPRASGEIGPPGRRDPRSDPPRHARSGGIKTPTKFPKDCELRNLSVSFGLLMNSLETLEALRMRMTGKHLLIDG